MAARFLVTQRHPWILTNRDYGLDQHTISCITGITAAQAHPACMQWEDNIALYRPVKKGPHQQC